MSRRTGIVAIALGLLSGCVPARDNPHDPSVAPAARLSMVTMGQDCPVEVDANADWPVVATASRGACLALDATETTDPQGQTMSFTYSYFVRDFDVDPTGNLVEKFIAEDVGANFLPVPEETLRGMPLVTVIPFKMTARDPSGAFESAFTSVVLTNTPAFAPLPAPVLLPEGGFPWAPGAPMTIALDGSRTSDADGDPPFFCWYLPETAPDSCEFEGAIWTRDIPPQAGRHVFYLEVGDGQDDSEKRTTIVRVGPPPIWTAGAGLVRFDETIELWTKPAGTVPWYGFGAGGEEWLLLYDDGAKEIEIYEWPSRVSTGLTIPLGAAQVAELAIATPRPGGGTRIWVAARTIGTSIQLKAYDLNVAGTTLTPVGLQTVSDMNVRVLSADFEGNVVLGGDSNIMEFVSANASTHWPVPLSAGTKIEGGGAIPETSIFSLTASGGIGDRIEVWEIRAPVLENDEPPGPVMPRQNQILEEGPLRQLEYFDNDRFWAAIPNTGLTLFERNSLTPIAVVPDILEVEGSLRVDQGTGTVHLATVSSLVSVDVRGRVRRSPIDAGSPVVHFVDAIGAVVRDSATPDVLRISRTLDTSGIVFAIDLQPLSAEREISDGGIWAVTSAAAIVHLAEDGTTLDYVTQFDVELSAKANLSAPVGVVDPGGRAGWFTEEGATGTVYRVDFLSAREATFRVPAKALASTVGFVPIGASNPTKVTPFAWMYDAGPPARYATLTTAGAFAVRFTEAGDESDSVAVVSHRTDDLCVFSEVDATSTIRHRRISPLGVVTPAAAIVASSGSLSLRSPFSFPEPEVCGVVAGTDDSHVVAWKTAAAAAPVLVAAHVDADDLTSVTAAAAGTYWGAGTLAADADARILVRMVLGTSGASARETFAIDVPNTPTLIP